jgi:hypothetical protein
MLIVDFEDFFLLLNFFSLFSTFPQTPADPLHHITVPSHIG